MIEAIKNFIKKIRLRLMFISLLLAFALWFICLNFADPVTYENYTLYLRLDNENVLTENNKMIENRRELQNVSVNVHVTGKKSELDYLAENRTIYAHVDLNSSELVNVSNTRIGQLIPVRVSVGFDGEASRGSYNITSVTPEIVGIVMDRIQSKPMNLAVVRTGEAPPGYVAMKTELDPSVVEVKGPSAVLAKMYPQDQLVMEVDLTEARSDIVETREIKAYDEFGVELTGLTLDRTEATFKIPIFRSVPVRVEMGDPPYVGEPSENVLITDVMITPDTVNILTDEDIPNPIEVITLDPPDISGLSEPSASFTYDLNEYLMALSAELGTELALETPEAGSAIVTYMTERIVTQEFMLSVDKHIHFSGEASLADRRRQILTEQIPLTLKGPVSVVANTSPDDIIGRVDLAPLAEMPDGEYDLSIEFDLPEGVEIAGDVAPLRIMMSSFEDGTAGETD